MECDDGQECVGWEVMCDGRSDCSDGSDEVGCTPDDCTRPGYWLCKDGSKCLMESFPCVLASECEDGSDESTVSESCISLKFVLQPNPIFLLQLLERLELLGVPPSQQFLISRSLSSLF